MAYHIANRRIQNTRFDELVPVQALRTYVENKDGGTYHLIYFATNRPARFEEDESAVRTESGQSGWDHSFVHHGSIERDDVRDGGFKHIATFKAQRAINEDVLRKCGFQEE